MKTTLHESEYSLLEAIYASIAQNEASKATSQRELAQASGLSLGMTNVLLKRFVERGWIKLSHLNKRKVLYALTAEGMEEISRRVVDYFSRASHTAALYRKRIDAFVRAATEQGYTALELVGPDELDFLFDYACEKNGLQFLKSRKGKHASSASDQKLVIVMTGDSKLESTALPAGTLAVEFSEILSLSEQTTKLEPT